MSQQITRVLLKHYVNEGEVKPDDFVVDKQTIQTTELGQDEVLLKVIYLSCDPYMRGRMREGKSYIPPFQPGQPIESGAISQVVKSNSPKFKEGEFINATLPWQDYVVIKASDIQDAWKLPVKIDNPHKLPLSYWLGVLGMPGLTAYGALKRIGKPKEGETVFVSAAAGAVGQVVGQLCKNVYKTRVIGSAGSDDKVDFLLKELGFDAAFNYKKISTKDALAKYAPNGIDMYYDNVGGETLEAALDAINTHGRIVCCGAISQYNKPREEMYGIKNMFNLFARQLLMQGFLVGSFAEELAPEFIKDQMEYVASGKLKAKEDVVKGSVDVAGQAFIDMMSGKNLGKTVVQIADDPFRK